MEWMQKLANVGGNNQSIQINNPFSRLYSRASIPPTANALFPQLPLFPFRPSRVSPL